MAEGQSGDDLRCEGHILSRSSGGGSGRDFFEASVYGPQVSWE